MAPLDRRRRYWQLNLRITGVLMALWFTSTFVVAFFARDIELNFFGWPLPVWVGSQGALLLYLALVWFYAWRSERLDREHGAEEND